jgi:hypothetical protein
MTATLSASPARSAVTERRLRRAGSIAVAAAANAMLWGVCAALGADFLLSDSMGTAVISLPIAVTATAIFGLLGWASLALLERFTRRARTVWIALAVTITAASIVPIFREHATGATRAALTVLHLAVAVVLVPGFRPGRR